MYNMPLLCLTTGYMYIGMHVYYALHVRCHSKHAAVAGLAAGVFSNNIDEVNTLSRGIKSGEGHSWQQC
jgi:hypothetical protein